MKNDTLVTINQVNGLFPVTVKEPRAICTAPEAVDRHAAANSSYFTTKLDTLGELVHFLRGIIY